MLSIGKIFKKYWATLVLVLIISGAIFVRTYHFQDWLYFKMDQARDAILLTKAVDKGPGYLPLLGARAGAVELKHGFLRLGPIDYYFQYLAGVLFGSTEAYVYAYPNLLFSILSIPLLYLLLRLYFSRKNALLISAMYAFSFLIIQYSRFEWNPNSLQFFLLLSFYGLLKFLNEKEGAKSKWLILWSAGITIGSQLHFFGFFSLLGISGLMVLIHFQLWEKNNFFSCFKMETLKLVAKYLAIAILVFTFFYTPVIISDIYNKGENTKNFFEAIGSKPANKPFLQKLEKSATENLKYYCLLTTSQCYGSSMKKEYPALAATIVIMLGGLILAIRKVNKKEKISQTKKDFLVLLLVWLAVYTILTIPVSFQLRPRFYIVVFALPFIFIGLIFEYLEEKVKPKQALLATLFLALGIIFWNSHGTYQWFKEQANAQKKEVAAKRTLILKNKDGVTLGQLQNAADWIYEHHSQGKTLYYYVKPEHVRPFDFLLSQKHDSDLIVKSLSINEDPNAEFFAVTPAKNGIEPVVSKYGKKVEILDSKQFGQLLVSKITFPDRSVSNTFKIKKDSASEDRIYWKDVFNLNK